MCKVNFSHSNFIPNTLRGGGLETRIKLNTIVNIYDRLKLRYVVILKIYNTLMWQATVCHSR